MPAISSYSALKAHKAPVQRGETTLLYTHVFPVYSAALRICAAEDSAQM